MVVIMHGEIGGSGDMAYWLFCAAVLNGNNDVVISATVVWRLHWCATVVVVVMGYLEEVR